MASGRTRGWVIDVVLGGSIGGVIGAIAAVNVVIYSGIEGGYQATLPEVFRQNLVVGLLTVAILVGTPALAVVFARRVRRGQSAGEDRR
jgi:hypothetical protein